MVSTNHSELSNQHVKISMQKEDGCLVKLKVHVLPETAKAAYQDAIKAVAKEVSVPGFRKGKVPSAMILQNFKPHVDREWRDVLLNRGLREFIDLTHVTPLNKESVQKAVVEKASLEEGADLLINFESAPEVPVVDPKSLRIRHVNKRTIHSEEIESSIAKVQAHYADWTPVTDRGVQEGDQVTIDAGPVEDPANLFYKDNVFIVDDENMQPWFKNAVLGQIPGATVNTRVDEQNIDLAITIKEIKAPKLPEIDDEFAKKAGAENLADMRQKITDQLEKNAEEEVKHALREQVGAALLEKYRFNVPASILKEEIKRMVAIKTKEMQDYGLDKAKINENLEKMRADLERECEEGIQIVFLENEVIHKHHIHVSDDEVVRELFAQIYRNPSAMQSARELLNSPEVHAQMRHMLTSQKVKDYLVEQAEKIEAS